VTSSRAGVKRRQAATVTTASPPNATQNGAVMPSSRATRPHRADHRADHRAENRKYPLLTRPRRASGTTRWRQDTVRTPHRLACAPKTTTVVIAIHGARASARGQVRARLDHQTDAQQPRRAEPRL
jgi:hypothetical protein